MSETPSSREVFLELLAGITAGRFTELAELYAEDAVVETVFQPVGPRRIEGRAALRARFAEVSAHSPWTWPPRTWWCGRPTTRRWWSPSGTTGCTTG